MTNLRNYRTPGTDEDPAVPFGVAVWLDTLAQDVAEDVAGVLEQVAELHAAERPDETPAQTVEALRHEVAELRQLIETLPDPEPVPDPDDAEERRIKELLEGHAGA